MKPNSKFGNRSEKLKFYRSIAKDYGVLIITSVQNGDTECKENENKRGYSI